MLNLKLLRETLKIEVSLSENNHAANFQNPRICNEKVIKMLYIVFLLSSIRLLAIDLAKS